MNKTVSIALALLALAPAAMAQKHHGPRAQNIVGWVSDEKCGAKGARPGHEACAKKCVEGGSAIVFVGDKNKTVYHVDNQDAVKEHLGHYVRVRGTMEGGNDTLHVDKVTMLRQPKGKPEGGEHGAG